MGHAEASRKVKGAPLARLTVDPNLPSHHFNQAGGNRQSESGSAVFSRRGAIGLCEGFEDGLLLLFRDSAPRIDDLEVKGDFPLRCRVRGGVHHHFAAVREFDRVTCEVQ